MIYKVIQSLQDPDSMEDINIITDLDAFNTDNWCDLSVFEDHEELKKYVTADDFDALLNGDADYIAFRLDY